MLGGIPASSNEYLKDAEGLSTFSQTYKLFQLLQAGAHKEALTNSYSWRQKEWWTWKRLTYVILIVVALVAILLLLPKGSAAAKTGIGLASVEHFPAAFQALQYIRVFLWLKCKMSSQTLLLAFKLAQHSPYTLPHILTLKGSSIPVIQMLSSAPDLCCAALAGSNNAAISQSGEAVGAGFSGGIGKPLSTSAECGRITTTSVNVLLCSASWKERALFASVKRK